MPAGQSKERVAVLGGGGGAIAAAMELTATTEQRSRYDVTVYTPGWRLGGKAASGRNADKGQRIEEHGLHVLFGFYDNAFQVVQDAYAEAGRPKGTPLDTWEHAFTPCDHLVAYDLWKGRAAGFEFKAPHNDRIPGDQHHYSFAEIVAHVAEQLVAITRELLDIGQGHGHHGALGGPHKTKKSTWGKIVDWFKKLVGKGEKAVVDEFRHLVTDLEHHLEHDIGLMLKHELGPLIAKFRAAANVVAEIWVKHHLDDDRVRFLWTSLDLASTILDGIIEDNLEGDGFQKVNGEEFRAWLHRHGAEDVTLSNSPLLRGLYDLTFAYEDGDIDKPNVAAGAAIEACIRIATQYKGHISYKMNAGMGDTIFGPMYEVLVKRGVQFEFFHWVDKLTVDPDSDNIETIEVFQQATPAADYDYLIDVEKVPSWPSEPDWSKLGDGDKLKASGVNLEHSPNPLNNPPKVLRRGTDFDHVVLGISVGALHGMCDELKERKPRFAAMLDDSRTTATQAIQVWSPKTTDELGWRFNDQSIAGAYREPVDTYCNMSHLKDREDWPEGEVCSIGYFCGPLKDTVVEGKDHDKVLAEVKQRGIDFFNTESADIWPKAQDSNGGFDWKLMTDADANASGEARFDYQYWRANTRGSERYAISPAKLIGSRLWPDESGFDNLVLAGDWTRNGIDGGSFEAAVASGRLASQAISGYPSHVPGTTGVLEDSRKNAAPAGYVDFGGLDTFPGPYQCKNTTLYSFMVTADEQKLQKLVDKVFTNPTRGAMRFAPLGPYVMLSLGDIVNVIPETPPFNTMGSVNETQVAVWVPMVQVDDDGEGKLNAKKFWMFTSYIWVNNSMSMATGREVFGWPKSLGTIKLPDANDPSFKLETYGLNFAPDNQPEYLPLLEMTPTGAKQSGASKVGHDLATLVGDMFKVWEDATGDHIKLTWDVGIDLVNDAATQAVPELYLKQFRSIENGIDAVYQAICEARAVPESLKFEGLTDDYKLTLHHVDSHPLAQDLGIEDQVVTVGFKIEMDFLQDVGNVLWEAGAED